MTAKQTWRRGKNLAEWNYNIGELSNTGEEFLDEPVWRRQWTARKIELLLDALNDFAWIESLSVDTLDGGENTWVADNWHPQSSRSQLLYFLEREETTNINILLSLECTAPGRTRKQKELWIESGANILVFVEPEVQAIWRKVPSYRMSLTLFLNVDIYAPMTWAGIRDNTELSKLNQPRLSAFLERLEEELEAKFASVYAPDYADMVEKYGFVAVGNYKRLAFGNSLAKL